MHEFLASLRIGNMIFMVSKLNKIFGKGFEVWNQIWKVFGLLLKNRIWKVKKKMMG